MKIARLGGGAATGTAARCPLAATAYPLEAVSEAGSATDHRLTRGLSKLFATDSAKVLCVTLVKPQQARIGGPVPSPT